MLPLRIQKYIHFFGTWQSTVRIPAFVPPNPPLYHLRRLPQRLRLAAPPAGRLGIEHLEHGPPVQMPEAQVQLAGHLRNEVEDELAGAEAGAENF